MRAILSDALESLAPRSGAGTRSRSLVRHVALALAIATASSACAAAQAGAVTLRLVFPDGQPMTYGSACTGIGCLQRGERIGTTDEHGEIALSGSSRTIEYRRNGILLGLVPSGIASGTIFAIGDRATVVLPRMLVGSAAAVDPVESDLVARLNEARAARGLSLAQINPKLSTAADMQATWLTQTGITFAEPGSFHTGPFGSDMAFRHGEVSLPDPTGGGEIAEAGGTIDQTVGDWLSSQDHRDQILAPGRLLIGAAKVGTFIIVQTHRPCAGCVEAGPGARMSVAQAPPPPPVGVEVAAPTTAGSGGDRGRQRGGLVAAVVRARAAHDPAPAEPVRPVRLRITTRCLRRGSPATRCSSARARPASCCGRCRIARAGTMTLSLRPRPHRHPAADQAQARREGRSSGARCHFGPRRTRGFRAGDRERQRLGADEPLERDRRRATARAAARPRRDRSVRRGPR